MVGLIQSGKPQEKKERKKEEREMEVSEEDMVLPPDASRLQLLSGLPRLPACGHVLLPADSPHHCDMS